MRFPKVESIQESSKEAFCQYAVFEAHLHPNPHLAHQLFEPPLAKA